MRQLPPFNFPRLLRYQVVNEQFFKKKERKIFFNRFSLPRGVPETAAINL